MGLPFLQKKRIQTILVGKKEEGRPMEVPESEHPLMPAMEEFAEALKGGDHQGMAKAFHAAFQTLESMPHDEGEHNE